MDAEDGNKALELLEKHAFHVILLDDQLPEGMRGVDVLRKASKDPKIKKKMQDNVTQVTMISATFVDNFEDMKNPIVQAIKEFKAGYVRKDVGNLPEVLEIPVRRALEISGFRPEQAPEQKIETGASVTFPTLFAKLWAGRLAHKVANKIAVLSMLDMILNDPKEKGTFKITDIESAQRKLEKVVEALMAFIEHFKVSGKLEISKLGSDVKGDNDAKKALNEAKSNDEDLTLILKITAALYYSLDPLVQSARELLDKVTSLDDVEQLEELLEIYNEVDAVTKAFMADEKFKEGKGSGERAAKIINLITEQYGQ